MIAQGCVTGLELVLKKIIPVQLGLLEVKPEPFIL
jgi:hypothetical protein